MHLVRYLIIAFTLSVVASNPLLAAQVAPDHGHKTPHGGIVQETEGMHAEFLLDKSGVPKLYLYDKAMKPLQRSDLEARLAIKGHGGAEHTRALNFSKDAQESPLFTGEPIKDLMDWDTAVVSIKAKDGWKHVRFSHH